MKRAVLLSEFSGTLGTALKQLQAEGVELDERSIRLWSERAIDLYRKLPDPLTAALAASVGDDETNHGGLLSRETLRLANVARRDVAPVDVSDV